VKRIVVRAVKLGLLISAAFAIVAFATSGLGAILLDVYLLAMGGVLLLALVRIARVKAPAEGSSRLDRALSAMRSARPDPDELGLVHDVEFSTLNAFHLHLRLRPVLREIAAHRLLNRFGVELDAEPARARELVGAAAWEVVRPDRPTPHDRLAVGAPLSDLGKVVVDLETI
jgi:hypothetical protein